MLSPQCHPSLTTVLAFDHGMTRAHRHHRPAQLRVRPVLAQYQVQPRGQLARHRHFGQRAMFARRQATIEPRKPPCPRALAARQTAVKLLRLGARPETPFLDLPTRVVKDRNLLKARMKITAYVGSFSEPWSFRHNQSTRCDEPTSLSNQAERRTYAFLWHRELHRSFTAEARSG